MNDKKLIIDQYQNFFLHIVKYADENNFDPNVLTSYLINCLFNILSSGKLSVADADQLFEEMKKDYRSWLKENYKVKSD